MSSQVFHALVVGPGANLDCPRRANDRLVPRFKRRQALINASRSRQDRAKIQGALSANSKDAWSHTRRIRSQTLYIYIYIYIIIFIHIYIYIYISPSLSLYIYP